MASYLQEYRRIPYYNWWKKKVLERDFYTCQECGIVGIEIEAHHISSFEKNVNRRFDPENGVALCTLCHGKKHGHPDGFNHITKVDECKKKKVSVYIENDKLVNAVKRVAYKQGCSLSGYIVKILEKSLIVSQAEEVENDKLKWWDTDEYMQE